MTPFPADVPPGAVLAHLGKGDGGMMAVRVAGHTALVRRADGLLEFPLGWTKALVKVTANETGLRVHEIEPHTGERAELTHLGFWLIGAFRVVRTAKSSHMAPRLWKEWGMVRPDESRQLIGAHPNI